GVAIHDVSGNVLRMAGSQTDITEGKVFDPLKGLPNRLLFIDRVGRLDEHRKRHENRLLAVLCRDLDGLKMISDSLGHLNVEQLLRDADTAMYRAKSLGKARYEVFDADMRAGVMARLQLETDLRRALERGEFQNFYQPIVALDSGEIAGFEALSRWRNPTRGLLGPNEFIPVAEATGLIREQGWWNLRE